MTDSIIYEAQPIPPDDPDGRHWSPIFGGIALIAVLLGAVAFGAALFRGDGQPDPLADPGPTQPAVTAPQASATTVAQSSLDRFGRDEGGSGAYSTQPARPGRDVGTPTPPLPAQEFTWDQVSLELPVGEEAYLQGVYTVDGGFIAVAMAYSEGGQDIAVWRSPDGLTWQPAELNGDFSDASVWNITFNEYGGIAFGEAFAPGYYSEEGGDFFSADQPERLVWTTTDGINWTRSEIEFATGANQSVWLNSGVAGPDGFLVIGNRQTSPEFTPMVIEKDGYQLILSEFTNSFQLLNASGEVVAQGSMNEFYNYDVDTEGQNVINPETGQLLTVVPYDIWEQAWDEAYRQSSGGPFGGFGGYEPTIVTIEYDAYRISVDEEHSTYTIEDLADGSVVFEGNATYLWQGPAPVITDDNGLEIIRFSWEEFNAAQETFWLSQEHDEYDYRSELVVATSSDGISWTTSVVESDAREMSLDSVVIKDGGFLAYGNHYDEFGGGPGIWTSRDGLTWERVADMPGGMYVWNVQQTEDGTLLAMGDGPQGASLWSSSDGIAWGEAFGARVPEDRSLYEYLNQFGTGELGTVVVGSREENYQDELSAEPLTLVQDEYTLTFDDYDWPPRVTIVDNITGDVVIDELLLEEGGLPEGFFYEDGVTVIENNNIVLMTITDDEWNSAQGARWMEIEGEYSRSRSQTTMYFSTDLNEWTEVPIDFQGWISTVAVGPNAVVLAGEEYGDEPYILEDAHDGEDFAYTPPNPVVFVGRP